MKQNSLQYTHKYTHTQRNSYFNNYKQYKFLNIKKMELELK